MKLCKRCNDRDAIEGEKYCGKCKPTVLKELRAAIEIESPLSVRTISRPGAEMVGRRCLDFNVTWDAPRDNV